MQIASEMNWHEVRDPNDAELDRLAEQYTLHSLHVEDCRHRGQIAKIEENHNYLFVVLKPVDVEPDGSLAFGDLDLFLGRDFLITVEESDSAVTRQLMETFRPIAPGLRADQLFYRVVDAVVDSYLPLLDRLDDLSDALEDEVLERPSPEALERIFGAKRNLVELRRAFANTRDVAGHLLRNSSGWIAQDMGPFLRDLYDHVARNLDRVEVQRELLTGALEIYLSSVTQRTNQVMKVLTVLGTIALPALLVTSFYGMNLQGLPWSHSPHGALLALAVIGGLTGTLLLLLRVLDWF